MRVFGAGSSNPMGDIGYSASPTNTAKSRGKQVRGDDGFHSRPPRPERNWLRKAAKVLGVAVCAVIAILILRETFGRYDGPQETLECTDIAGVVVCN